MKTRVFTAPLSRQTVQSKRKIATSLRDISKRQRASVDSTRATCETVNYAFFTFCFLVNKYILLDVLVCSIAVYFYEL